MEIDSETKGKKSLIKSLFQKKELQEEDQSFDKPEEESGTASQSTRVKRKNTKATPVRITDDYSFWAHGKKHYYSSMSLGLFSNKSYIRKKLVWLVTWKYFEIFITFCILANSAFLGLMDYKNPDSDIWQNQLTARSENVFTVIFILECICKILAMGLFIGKGSYLRNAWNWLDFTVVITSLLALTPTMGNVSGLRTFRLFRPLRNLTTVPSMRTLVGTLLQSMGQLGGVLSLAIFFFLIFAILGVSLWSGVIHNRCWELTLDPLTNQMVNNWDKIILDPIQLCQSSSQCGLNQVCSSYLDYLIESGKSLKPGYSFTEVEELNWGITNFDNIFSAFLTIFQCITMEGWTNIMYIYMDAYNKLIVVFYYIFCVVVCSLFLLNMTIAVMLNHYEDLDKKEAKNTFSEIRDAGKLAKIPNKLINFIIEHDMCVTKPKKQDESEEKPLGQRICDFLTDRVVLPNGSYYQNILVKILFYICMHPIFQSFIMLIISINTIVLALDQYPEHTQEMRNTLADINLAFTVIFTAEVVIKIIGLGFRSFCREKFNIFDLVIVIVSLVEISLSDNGGAFSALRAFRLFRIFKLFRVGDLRVLIDSIGFTIMTIGNYTVLLILFIYVYALLGMQFFAGQLKFDTQGLPDPDGRSPRANFDNLLSACTTIFTILIGDDWNSVMYNCIRTVGSNSSIYFITLILFGNIIMLNLFLAILLGNFDRARLHQVKMKIMENFIKMREKYNTEKALYMTFPELPQQMAKFLLGQRSSKSVVESKSHAGLKQKSSLLKSAKSKTISSNRQSPSNFEESKKSLQVVRYADEDQQSHFDRDDESNQKSYSQQRDEELALQSMTKLESFKDNLSYRSLFIFHMDSGMRKFCLKLVTKNDEEIKPRKEKRNRESIRMSNIANSLFNKEKKGPKVFPSFLANGAKNDHLWAQYFDYLILFLIVLSSLSLAFDDPLSDPDSTFKTILFYIDQIFTFAFTIELTIKVIALGFFFNRFQEKGETGRQAYIRSAWNILDFIVVFASLFDFFVWVSGREGGRALKSLKALRALRALRPLRVIAKNEGLRLVVNALLASIPAMTNVILVCLLFLLIFAIMGINFFKGSFYACEKIPTSHPQDILSQIDTKLDCLNYGGHWENSRSNFDNIFNAVLCLFEMMTTEGWLNVMYKGMDARGIGLQPERESSNYNAIFFIAFMIIGSQFILNLFVGIVIDNFNKIKDKELGNIFLTESQKSWVDIQRFMLTQELRVKHKPPTNPTRLQCYKLVTKSYFDYFITSCILANTIIMAVKHYTMSEKLQNTFENLNYVFAAIFNIEAILKLTALGKKYFYDQWNIFDFIVVFGTNIGIVISRVAETDISTAASVIRGFRIMRIFRLIRSAKNIKVILDTVVKLLPQITNIMLLIFLLFFIYAALGINLFSEVKFQQELNPKNNFRTFEGALLVLMRCATGEDWNLIMSELTITDDGSGTVCKNSQTYEEMQRDGINGCGSPVFAYLYFISFMIVISMLIMNLSVATVIEGLNSATNQNSGLVTKEDTEAFLNLWMEYDQQARGFISQWDVVFFLYELPSPFTIKDLEKGTYFEKSYLVQRDFLNKVKHKKHYEWQNDKFLVNEDRNLFILKIDALQILKVIRLPVYDHGEVHFKDVYKRVVKNVMAKHQQTAKQQQLNYNIPSMSIEEQQDDDYKLGNKIRNRLKKEWSKKYRGLKKHKKQAAFTEDSHTVTKSIAMDIITQFIKRNKDKFNKPKDTKKKKRQEKSLDYNTPFNDEEQQDKDVKTDLETTRMQEEKESKLKKRRQEKNRQEQKWLYYTDQFEEELGGNGKGYLQQMEESCQKKKQKEEEEIGKREPKRVGSQFSALTFEASKQNQAEMVIQESEEEEGKTQISPGKMDKKVNFKGQINDEEIEGEDQMSKTLQTGKPWHKRPDSIQSTQVRRFEEEQIGEDSDEEDD